MPRCSCIDSYFSGFSNYLCGVAVDAQQLLFVTSTLQPGQIVSVNAVENVYDSKHMTSRCSGGPVFVDL
jgi:hypothetical protein